MRLLAERKVRIELTPAARERVVVDGYDRLRGEPAAAHGATVVQDHSRCAFLRQRSCGDLVRVDVDRSPTPCDSSG